jgi:hypothetical protein
VPGGDCTFAESTLLTELNRATASLYPLFATYEHSELANPTLPPRRRTITGGSSSQSPAVRGPSRTFSYNVRASVPRYVRLVHISDSTTKNGVNQKVRFRELDRTRNATQHLQSVLVVMMDDIKSNIKVCLDDCLLHTKTEDDLLETLNFFFKKCQEHRLNLHARKCVLFASTVR